MTFEEDGTVVFGQYFYGEESVQIYSPVRTIVIEEKSKDDLSVTTEPKTFFINTTQGYFWVEVRYNEGLPVVILTPFVAKKPADDGTSEEFVYPGMGIQSAGMLTGVISDSATSRYVVTQGAGVFGDADVNNGAVLLAPSCEDFGRITPKQGVAEYTIVVGDRESRSIRQITIDDGGGVLVAVMKHLEVSSLLAVEDGLLPVSILHNAPIWVHRKCLGSYFSPNKTIGYHVDIGADDGFLGNVEMVRGADLLDNTGGFPESMFNHTPDLARFINILNFPVAVSGSIVTIVLESPTMLFDNGIDPRCWGGYSMTSWEFECADYQQDFQTWYLAPRAVLAVCDLSSGAVTFSDITDSAVEYKIVSWDGHGEAILSFDSAVSCDTVGYDDIFPPKTQDGNCDWQEECSGTCGYDSPTPYSGICAKIWDVYKQRSFYIRENLSIKRHMFFLFGESASMPFNPAHMNGFFLLFDGHWHLDVGLQWARQTITGDYCQICSMPPTGQAPGELIYFSAGGTSGYEHLESFGREYVENLEIISPLGWYIGPWGLDMFGFIARVPEYLAAPHEPVVLVGGIEYPSAEDSDAFIRCERALTSTPCECENNPLTWAYSTLPIPIYGGNLAVSGGCGPYNWVAEGADLVDALTSVNYGRAIYKTLVNAMSVVAHTPQCGIKVTVWDACYQSIITEAVASVGEIVGPDVMTPNTTSAFYIESNTSEISYSGTLELVSQSGTQVILRMPEGACGGEYDVTLTACGVSATKKVIPTSGSWVQIGTATWLGGSVSGIGSEVWSIFPNGVPGSVYVTASGGYTLRGEATFGKYRCFDYRQVWGTSSTPESCQPHGAPFCAACPGGYIYPLGNTTDCFWFDGKWCANGEQSRILQEWKCV